MLLLFTPFTKINVRARFFRIQAPNPGHFVKCRCRQRTGPSQIRLSSFDLKRAHHAGFGKGFPAANAEKEIPPVSRMPVSVPENLIIALCILGDAAVCPCRSHFSRMA